MKKDVYGWSVRVSCMQKPLNHLRHMWITLGSHAHTRGMCRLHPPHLTNFWWWMFAHCVGTTTSPMWLSGFIPPAIPLKIIRSTDGKVSSRFCVVIAAFVAPTPQMDTTTFFPENSPTVYSLLAEVVTFSAPNPICSTTAKNSGAKAVIMPIVGSGAAETTPWLRHPGRMTSAIMHMCLNMFPSTDLATQQEHTHTGYEKVDYMCSLCVVFVCLACGSQVLLQLYTKDGTISITPLLSEEVDHLADKLVLCTWHPVPMSGWHTLLDLTIYTTHLTTVQAATPRFPQHTHWRLQCLAVYWKGGT